MRKGYWPILSLLGACDAAAPVATDEPSNGGNAVFPASPADADLDSGPVGAAGSAQGMVDPGALADAAHGSSDASPATDSGTSGQTSAPCGMPILNQNPGNACHDTPPPPLKLTPIVDDGEFFAPLMLASPPGDASRLFVITRNGTVRIIKDGALLAQPFLDIRDITAQGTGSQEFGLLGIAFDPAFASTGKVWLHYNTDASPIDSVTASVLVSSSDPDMADRSTLTTLFTENQPATNHNGGMLAFGEDNCLYVGLGDGGGGGDPNAFGQNTDEPMGSILRLDPTTGAPAPGNPGYGDPRIWNYGLRNPWRFSFDRATWDLYIGDVGQGASEEVDVEPAGSGDHNYGWKIFEGSTGFRGAAADAAGMRMPAKEYLHAGASASITGGYVYRGTAIPGLVGRYLYADFKRHQYWSFTYSGESLGDNGFQPQICDDYELTADLGAAHQPTAFGQDAAGELYILTLSGAIYRIDPA